jgi:hypothetical protein
MLGGHGVSSLHDALQVLRLKPAHDRVREVLSPKYVQAFVSTTRDQVISPESVQAAKRSRKARNMTSVTKLSQAAPELDPGVLSELRDSFTSLLNSVRELSATGRDNAAEPISSTTWKGSSEDAVAHFERTVRSAVRLPALEELFATPWPQDARKVLPSRNSDPDDAPAIWATVLAWAAMKALGCAKDPINPEHAAARLMDDFRLREPIADAFQSYGLTGEERWQAAARVRAALAHASWGPGAPHAARDTAPFSWMNDPDVAWLLGVNEHEGVRYLMKEPFEELLWWLSLPAMVRLADEKADTGTLGELEQELYARILCAAEAGYRVDGLFEPERLTSAAQSGTAQPTETVKQDARKSDTEPVQKSATNAKTTGRKPRPRK